MEMDSTFLVRFFRVHHKRFFVDEHVFLRPFVERAILQAGGGEECTLANPSAGGGRVDHVLQPQVRGCISRGVHAVGDAIVCCFVFGVLSFLSLSELLSGCNLLDSTSVHRALLARQAHLLRLVNELMDAPVDESGDGEREWGAGVFATSCTPQTFWELSTDNVREGVLFSHRCAMSPLLVRIRGVDVSADGRGGVGAEEEREETVSLVSDESSEDWQESNEDEEYGRSMVQYF